VACSDSNACTVNDSCTQGKCLPGPALACDDKNVCTQDTCDPAVGCAFAPVPGACDDGNACTKDDLCSNGTCQPGAGIACSDGNKCTNDSCDPTTGCKYTPISPCCGNGVKEGGEQCDDGNSNDGDQCKNDCTLPIVKTYHWVTLGTLSNAFNSSWKDNIFCNAGSVNTEYYSESQLTPSSPAGPHHLYGPTTQWQHNGGAFRVKCVYE